VRRYAEDLQPPADRRALIAIDLGAESCRVSLLQFDRAGKPHIELIHRFANNAVQRADGLRWNLDAILNELHKGLEQCAAQSPQGIRSIAVDGWAVDYVRLDPQSGRAVGDPFCYRDPRSDRGQQSLHELLSAERMRELTGIQVLSLNTVYQMASESRVMRQLRWLNLPEYILYTLGARPVAELTNATHTQMVDLGRTWCSEILETLGMLTDWMPEIVSPGTVIGMLQAPDLCKLPAFASTRLVAPACHDTASAIAAIPDCGDDWAYISSGTWSLVGTLLAEPLNTPEACAENFTNLAGVDGTVCFHKNVNGMWLLRQCLESWNSGVDQASSSLTIGPLVEAAASFRPRSYVLNIDDPALLRLGNMPELINAQLLARDLPEFSTAVSDAPELASFLFESLAARYAEILARLPAITGCKLRKVYVMGGGSQNALLNRLIATATGLEVLNAGAECSTVGNLACQLEALEHTTGSRPTARWAAMLNHVA
jgi:rhamnulokinase